MNIKDVAILKSIKTGQTTLLQAVATTVQKLTLEQKAAMDEATYSSIKKSGNNYVLGYLTSVGDSDLPEVSTTSITWIVAKTITATDTRQAIQFDSKNGATNYRDHRVGYTINSDIVGDVVSMYQARHNYYITTTYPVTIALNDVVRVWLSILDVAEETAYVQNVYLVNNAIIGTIKSAAIAKDANIGLRYWGDIVANLVAGAAGSTIKAKICDSAGTALHTNFVTIAAAEYARIPLERPVVLTASSGGQTVWDFTSLSNADAFINELGVLAKALIVELALDGTNYTVLKEVTNFNEDISNILAPRITLVSGMGVVNGTSKLRATYIVNIPLSNTTIKLQVQLNRLAVGDTSPSIQPFVGDATKYVGAGQVAII